MRGVDPRGHRRAAEGQRLPLRAVAEPAGVGADHRRRTAATPTATLYLTTALGIGTAPPFKIEVAARRRASRRRASRSDRVVILNDAAALSTPADEALKRFVTQGGGLFIVARRPHCPGAATSRRCCPARPDARRSIGSRGGGGTLGVPRLQPSDLRGVQGSAQRQLRRPCASSGTARLTPGPTDRVLARFDDGAAAMVERRGGQRPRASRSRRRWTSRGTTSRRKPMFLPLVHEIVRYLAQYASRTPWYTVGRMLDISVPIAAIVREGAAGDAASAARRPSGVVDGAVRRAGHARRRRRAGDRAGRAGLLLGAAAGHWATGGRYQVAVNLDPAESDLTPLPPAEFVAAATGRAAVTHRGAVAREPGAHPGGSREEAGDLVVPARRPAPWLLLVEAVLANRLSKRFGFGLS